MRPTSRLTEHPSLRALAKPSRSFCLTKIDLDGFANARKDGFCGLKIAVLIFTILLNGCLGSYLWTGANLFYDRHSVYKKVNDYELSANANQLVFKDDRLKCPNCMIDITAFNSDLLLSGHLPTLEMKQELEHRVAHLPEYRHIYNKVVVSSQPTNTLDDSWITTKIRTQIISDDNIDPHPFKVVTTDKIVYLMGEVEAGQARRILQIARETPGVIKVVKLMKTYIPK
jgi:osmotically-inducible protein OsmY